MDSLDKARESLIAKSLACLTDSQPGLVLSCAPSRSQPPPFTTVWQVLVLCHREGLSCIVLYCRDVMDGDAYYKDQTTYL
ncbi:hypothetical protein E2C01_091771 [Portunus trituberculatus]|uniref:Uncharacterized protein n=1 Tax=Portunus trituberculatus TaxID=210409 RepID=A0A5B7JTU5_PORTR|nr:hypothetical protein [Portunus trituberculatus]